MLRDVLQLSNSRAILVGAVLVDTICFGTLALLLTLPKVVFGEAASITILVALAITAPILAIGIGAMSAMVPQRFEAEERARRAILAGTVLHIGIQSSAMLAMLCHRGPTSPAAYVLHSFGWMMLLIVMMAIAGTMMKLRAGQTETRKMREAEAAPDGRL